MRLHKPAFGAPRTNPDLGCVPQMMCGTHQFIGSSYKRPEDDRLNVLQEPEGIINRRMRVACGYRITNAEQLERSVRVAHN